MRFFGKDCGCPTRAIWMLKRLGYEESGDWLINGTIQLHKGRIEEHPAKVVFIALLDRIDRLAGSLYSKVIGS